MVENKTKAQVIVPNKAHAADPQTHHSSFLVAMGLRSADGRRYA